MKLQSKITAVAFVACLFAGMSAHLLTADVEFSDEEKRTLTQFEAPSISTLADGSWFDHFESYTLDQFPLRQGFRTLHAYLRADLYCQQDIGGIYTQGDYIFKSDYPLKPDNIDYFSNKTNQVYQDFIAGKADNYYVSVVPDKSYYDDGSSLTTDAQQVADQFTEALVDAEYIDIFDALTLQSYYKTDTHWSQDQLFSVMDVFSAQMGFAKCDQTLYNETTLADFHGVYDGQSAMHLTPDELIYLESIYTQTATVENLDHPNMTQVYDLDAFDSEDGYNLFLSGGSPLITISSPNAQTDRELIIFRDSFGSSIAPLFLEQYQTVTLIDLRYFTSIMLDDYVDFEGKDVLVLYSSLILNSSVKFR